MALIVNTIMFAVEIAGGLHAGSVSLLADAVDFAGDAANYALSLTVLSLGLMGRARAALVKGITMGGGTACSYWAKAPGWPCMASHPNPIPWASSVCWR
ncbi:MAG: cation transporter [Candidatus Thiodiazotropha sp.]